MTHFKTIVLSCLLLAAGLPTGAVGADAGLEDRHVIDWHAHVAGLGYGDSGAFIGDGMRRNFRFRFFLRWMGVTEEELQAEGDGLVVRRLSEKIARSRYVDQAVVLAFDGIVDKSSGVLDKENTQFYVPNDFVQREAAKYPNLLFGASINPYRRDSLALLEEVAARGAVLVKWIPSIMHIDPADEAIVPFYRKMAVLGLPLLSHAGQERSFAHAHDEYSDPMRLTLPLQHGVTVIAAHIATTGESEGQDNFQRILPMFAVWPNLYTDISSLTQINKLGYLAKALAVPGLTARMLYGTDWPLQYFPLVSPWFHVNHVGLRSAWRVSRIENEWDRDVALKQAFGVPEAVFTRTLGILTVP